MKYLISGSHGFIGSALTRYLEGLGHEVIPFRIRTEPENRMWQRDCDVDFAIHCAIDHSRPESIIAHAQEFMDIAQYVGCKKFLFLSSGAAKNPTTDYGMAKLITEKMLCRNDKMEIKIARIYALSGVGLPLDKNLALGNFVGSALRGEPIVMNTTGFSTRSYLDVDDLAWWLDTILLNGNNKEIYEVGSNYSTRIRYLADLVHRIKPVPSIKYGDDPTFSDYVPDTTKAQELGLYVKTPLEESIKKMIAHGL